MTNAAANFIAQWRAGFVFPAIFEVPHSAMSSETCSPIPFVCLDEEKADALRRVSKMVEGRCDGFVIRDETGEHYDCSCVIGLLYDARSQKELERFVEGYRADDARRVLEYLKRIYPERYNRLRKD